MKPNAFHEQLRLLRGELAHKRWLYIETIDRVSIELLEELIRRAKLPAPPAPEVIGGSWFTPSAIAPFSHLRNEAERQWDEAWAGFDRTRRTSVKP